MDIKQRIQRLIDALKSDADSPTWREIDRLDELLEEFEKLERFDRFFAAALQGLLAANQYNVQSSYVGDERMKLIAEARIVARLCVQAQPGEDS